MVSSSVTVKGVCSHVSHLIVNTGDGVGGWPGCLIDVYAHGQGLHEVPSYGGLGCTEFVCPAHSGGVVAPGCHMDVSKSGKVV